MRFTLKHIFTFIALLSITYTGFAQFASKKIKPKYEAYNDSLKKVKYNYVFPFWGQEAYKKGIDLQYPIGIMANYFWVKQDILIDNFQLGFDDINDKFDMPLTPVPDSIVSFGTNSNTSYSINVRPDIWLYPFIDLYGIFGYGYTNTQVEVIANLPGSEPLNFTAGIEEGVATYGTGILVAGGVGPVWFSLDGNFTWNKLKSLNKPTMGYVVGLRIGKMFVFKNKPESNISLWAGSMFMYMQSATDGASPLVDVLDDAIWEKKDEIVSNYWDWHDANYDDLPPIKKKIVDEIYTPIIEALDAKDGSSMVLYNMDKQVKQKFNGLFGIQYQLNKNWQFRSEGGVIGNRKSFILSVNYRLLGFRKKAKIL